MGLGVLYLFIRQKVTKRNLFFSLFLFFGFALNVRHASKRTCNHIQFVVQIVSVMRIASTETTDYLL